MAVSGPREPVYYYECSGGDFRLTLFVPPHLLPDGPRRDHPDGVDMGCTTADFDEFEREYEWRPDVDPDRAKNAFLALFSSTKGWKTFRGSGFIPARDLEPLLPQVPVEARPGAPILTLEPESWDRAPKRPSATERHRRKVAQDRTQRALEQMEVAHVDPTYDLREQRFSQIEWDEDGDSAAQVFSKLHAKRRG